MNNPDDASNSKFIANYNAIIKAHEHPKPPHETGKRRRAKGITEETCHICGYKTKHRYYMARHMISHSEVRPYICSLCDRGFKTKTVLINHVYSHVGFKPWDCEHCDQSFTSSGLLIRHVRYRHTGEKKFGCQECGSRFVESSKLKGHMRVHTGERPYQCPQCSYASKNLPCLKRHIRSHTGVKAYECNICQKRFTVKNSMMFHRLSHTGGKPALPCAYCTKTFTRNFYRSIHIRDMHTDNGLRSCRKCGKSFRDKYTFNLHRKTHVGEKCYKCLFCNKTFLSNSARQTHTHVHTGERPFTCGQCDQSFRQRPSLKRHQNLYHNPSQVPSVLIDLATKSNIEQFSTEIENEGGYQCGSGMCNKKYQRKGNFERHIASHALQNKENLNPNNITTMKRGRGRPKGSKNRIPRFVAKYTKINTKPRKKSSTKPSNIVMSERSLALDNIDEESKEEETSIPCPVTEMHNKEMCENTKLQISLESSIGGENKLNITKNNNESSNGPTTNLLCNDYQTKCERNEGIHKNLVKQEFITPRDDTIRIENLLDIAYKASTIQQDKEGKYYFNVDNNNEGDEVIILEEIGEYKSDIKLEIENNFGFDSGEEV